MNEGRSTFRYTIGLIAVLGGLGGMAGLYFADVPTGNQQALLLALGVVLGWGGAVVNGEWGSSPAGRRAAEVGVEAGRKANDAPAGTPADPVAVQGAPAGTPPVTVQDKPDG